MNGHNRLLPYLLASGGVMVVSVLHYATDLGTQAPHELFRRLYYLPIVYAALSLGWKGGILTAGLAVAVYLPHMLIYIREYPQQAINNYAEMGLFFAFGGGIGYLTERLRHGDRLAVVEATASYCQHNPKRS